MTRFLINCQLNVLDQVRSLRTILFDISSTKKAKDRATRTQLNTGVNSDALE
jgi:hypothetical protein